LVKRNEDVFRVGIARHVKDDPQNEHDLPEQARPQPALENVERQRQPVENIKNDLQDSQDVGRGKFRMKRGKNVKVEMFGHVGSKKTVRPARGQQDREGEINLPCSSEIRGHAFIMHKFLEKATGVFLVQKNIQKKININICFSLF